MIRSLCLGLVCSLASTLGVDAADRPNIVVVMIDDLGYGDLGCYGNRELKTPNVDHFATEGLRLTSCYAAHANCSPSRTALMTGRTPTRVGVRNWIPEESPVHVPRSEITVAQLLKQAGYTTCLSGKWHLNGEFNLPSQPQPNDLGFDHWFATQNNAMPNHHNPDNFARNCQWVGKIDGYAAQIVVDEAVQWLTKLRDPSKPFFLYVSIHEPHEPIATAEEFTKLYPSDDPSYSAHHGNISQMDDAFGRLMCTLDDEGLRDNTLVLYTSDNGPAITSYHPHGSAGPLRDKKGSLWEGGIRVPGILRWPCHTQPGTESDEPVSGVDVLPTLCAVAGIEPPQDRVLDGASFLSILDGKPVQRSTPLYWHFNKASGEPKVAIRVGDWKLLATLDTDAPGRTNDITKEEEQAFKDARLDKFFLYNLQSDISETTDLAAQEPAKLAELKALMEAKYKGVVNESPTWPAWKFTGVEGKKIIWPEYTKKGPKK